MSCMNDWPFTTLVELGLAHLYPPSASIPAKLGLGEKIPRQLLKKMRLRGPSSTQPETLFPAATFKSLPGMDDQALAAAATSSAIWGLGAPSRFKSNTTGSPLSGSNQRTGGLNARHW